VNTTATAPPNDVPRRRRASDTMHQSNNNGFC